jgi:hypothetical protein
MLFIFILSFFDIRLWGYGDSNPDIGKDEHPVTWYTFRHRLINHTVDER